MKEMSFNMDAGESSVVFVDNVKVHVWMCGNGVLELSTSIGGENDNIQVTIDSLTGEILQIKKPFGAKEDTNGLDKC